MHRIQAHICTARVFETVKKYVSDFELDDRQLQKEEFLTMCKDDKLLAFGRVRKFEGFSELCTLGVIESARHQGLASRLVSSLVKSCKQPIYLVSIIPDFFTGLGFQICEQFPSEIAEKLAYCTNSLPVPEAYVVMRLNTN